MSSEFMRRAYMMKVAEEDEVVAKALYPYAECALDNAFGVIKEDINAAPDVDAVEVVRCKYCKHCYEDGDNVVYNCCELNQGKAMPDDWFCAGGERKEVSE